MRTQSETTGVNARGSFVDLQEYDQKLKPSPLVPRKKLKKEGFVNEAFIRGFFDELEKKGAVGALLARSAAALKGAGGLKGLGGKALGHGKTMLKDPFTQMQIGQSVLGGIQAKRQASQQAKAQQTAARSGMAPAAAKKPTGLLGGLGFGGSQ